MLHVFEGVDSENRGLEFQKGLENPPGASQNRPKAPIWGCRVPAERAGRSGSNFQGVFRVSRESFLPNFKFTPLLVGSELAGKGSARGTFQIFFPGFYAGRAG